MGDAVSDELKHDPELPYVYLGVDDIVFARFRDEEDAGIFEERVGYGEVVDTTPKPKIPEDAEFIYWENGAGKTVAVRQNYNPNKPWEIDGVYFGEPELLLSIGDAEVTVLVRKEES